MSKETDIEIIGARRAYVQMLRRDLVGPGSEDRSQIPSGCLETDMDGAILDVADESDVADYIYEIITERPGARYKVGLLYPQETKLESNVDGATDPDGEIESEDNTTPIESHVRAETNVNAGTDDVADDGDSFDLSATAELANNFKPSSLGFTFFSKNKCSSVTVKFFFATYSKAQPAECRSRVFVNRDVLDRCMRAFGTTWFTVDDREGALFLLPNEDVGGGALPRRDEIDSLIASGENPDNVWEVYNAIKELSRQLRHGYRRVPHVKDLTVAIDELTGSGYAEVSDWDPALVSVSVSRRNVDNKYFGYTVMLINATSENHNATVMAQARLQIGARENPDLEFVTYSGLENAFSADAEERSLALLYRKKEIYATGLGTAVDWGRDKNGNFIIRSECMPVHEVPGMDFDLDGSTDEDKATLSMKNLSDMSTWQPELMRERLEHFVGLYEAWITGLTAEANGMAEGLREVANVHLQRCGECLRRMRRGIEIIINNDNARKAFLWTNRAMFMQQIQRMLQDKLPKEFDPTDPASEFTQHNRIMSNYAVYERVGTADEPEFVRTARSRMPSWRPFQLAFLLMSIPSMVEDSSDDRNLVDLIWFPTGGGKTEAYLGLTAFTIFYRRLAHLRSSKGTAVMMRYTLRLLAAQQFERASTLICACEIIRRNNDRQLGNESITIGLWIGGTQTPNTFQKAQSCLNDLVNNNGENKFQVLRCPWCGAPLRYGNDVAKWGYFPSTRAFHIRCVNQGCVFMRGLPQQVVDEGIYAASPTLLFGTVDKFAQITWRQEAARFFACDARNQNRSPELIIQDELHLISGPLGTIVGLYEAAIDYLCSVKGVRPKIIASTATIRRAAEQCSMLYNRAVRQFPPPGLEAGKSFFATEKPIDHARGDYGRLYVGIMPSGESKATMFARTMASLLLRQIGLRLSSDGVRDLLWTVTAYFNSLRDLGNASSYLEADVPSIMNRMRLSIGSGRRPILQKEELTSRVSASELTAALEQLSDVHYTSDRQGAPPTDVLLATNMISVGIDISRLNVMLMEGQPKLTSEYIQASSRVGRNAPGVVNVLYDAMKSRDRSYYEQFKSYHDAYYKYVEPTGVTPFSRPVLDRCLHAAIIACLRATPGSGLAQDGGAGHLSTENHGALMQRIKEFFLCRLRQIINRAKDEGGFAPAGDDDLHALGGMVQEVYDKWLRIISSYGEENVKYGDMMPRPNPNVAEVWLMKPFGFDVSGRQGFQYLAQAFDTLTAMRNVDTTVHGFVREEA